MDLSDPTKAVTSTLDGAVLAVLAAAGRPMTVGQVAEHAVRGSEIGIRRSLGRLVEQGTVRATLMGRNHVHELNRDHVAAGVAVALADLRPQLWQRFRDELGRWRPRPLFACVFGSAARGDGDVSSDIDLLLVHPPFPGEKKPPRMTASMKSTVADALGEFVASSGEVDPAPQWEQQVDGLRESVQAWTGNHLQIIDLSFHDWRRPDESSRALFTDIARDGIELVKSRTVGVWPAKHDRG